MLNYGVPQGSVLGLLPFQVLDKHTELKKRKKKKKGGFPNSS